MKLFRNWLTLLPLFFPLYLIRFDVVGIPTTLLELVVGVTAVVGGLFFVRPKSVRKWWKKERKKGLRTPLIPMVLFVVAATISMLIVPVETLAIDASVVQSGLIAQGIWKGWIVMPLVYFGMVYAIPRDDRDAEFWRQTLLMLLFSGFALSLIAIYQVVTGDFMTMDGRASGPFESANYLSLYLGPIALFSIINTVHAFTRSRLELIFNMLVLVVIGLALGATQSYAAVIAVAAGLLFFLIFNPWIPRKIKWRFLGVGLLAGVGLVLAISGTPKFQQFIDFSGRSSSTVRLEVYEIAGALIQQHPILGLGLGQFEVQYGLNAPEILAHPPMEWVMLHPHNLGLAFWLNTGLLGLLAMIWLVGLVFWNGFHRMEGGGGEPVLLRWFHKIKARMVGHGFPYQLIGLSMLVVILTHGLFDTPFFKNDLAYLWWLVVLMGV